ncbi:MAG: hypothetical protein Tsb0014_00370 [Pleurocapsa sp.]
MPSIKEQLSQDMADVSWKDLLPHARRDAVIVVERELDLTEVGVAIAQDNTTSVQSWIENKSIYKPSSEQLTNWNQNLEKQFTTLIVQPFVIIQET